MRAAHDYFEMSFFTLVRFSPMPDCGHQNASNRVRSLVV